MTLSLFALQGSRPLGEAIADHLDLALGRHEEREFEDGEHKARPLESVRGADVYVVHSLYGGPGQSVNDKLCRLLFFLGALRDAGAERVTAVVPYLCYGRKERKTKVRDPVTTRYVASLFEAVGVDRVVSLDVHDLAAFQNAFRCRTEHLEARPLFVRHLQEVLGDAEPVVVSPDVGGVKRAQHLAAGLGAARGAPVPLAFLEKRRSEGEVSGEALVGDVTGRVAVIVDDLVGTGTTLARAVRTLEAAGAEAVHAVATHGLFVGDAGALIASPALASMVVTDSVPPFRLGAHPLRRKVVVLPLAPLLAEAIGRLHGAGPVTELLGDF